MNTTPDEGNHDIRLVPLDPWERDWIFGAAQHALHLQATVLGSTSSTFRLEELLHKMRPRVGTKKSAERFSVGLRGGPPEEHDPKPLPEVPGEPD